MKQQKKKNINPANAPKKLNKAVLKKETEADKEGAGILPDKDLKKFLGCG